jgi:hypothetical protein
MKYYVLTSSPKTNGLDMFPAGDSIKFKIDSDTLSIPSKMEMGDMILVYQSAPKDKFNSVFKLINYTTKTLVLEKEFEVNGGVGLSDLQDDVRGQINQGSSDIFEIDKSTFESICNSMFGIACSEFIGKPFDSKRERKNEEKVDFFKMTPDKRKEMFEDYVDTMDKLKTTQRHYKKSMCGNEMMTAVNKATDGNVSNVYEINDIDLLELCRDNLRPINGKRQDAGFPLTAIGWYITMIDHVEKQSYKAEVQPNNSWEQIIYFGAPGSGKSHEVKRIVEETKLRMFNDEEKNKHIVRTTFHPDYDYSGFVGAYKPYVELFINNDGEEEKKITYKFVPQAFSDIYVRAWKDISNPYYLIIEEINRGNCAQIFGDLFQLLDRKKDTGMSDYQIMPNIELREFLIKELGEENPGIKNGMRLPPNLSIYATMNTSDQSLFPMDSAFKRRWDWEYVPIDYNNIDSAKFEMIIGGEHYNWHEFLKEINEKIKNATSSEDKQMGNFFIKHSVNEKEFCDKVMFYLWSEVGKDNYKTNDAIFKWRDEKDEDYEFTFNELYSSPEVRNNLLKGFICFVKDESRKEKETKNATIKSDSESDAE